MTSAAPIADAACQPLAEKLIDQGLLIPTSVPGIWGKSAAFEHLISGLESAIDRMTESDRAERLRFPPVIGRADFEQSEFLKSFPHLAGSVYAFSGDSAAHQSLLDRIESGA